MAIIKKEDFKCPGFKRDKIFFWYCRWIFKTAICMYPGYPDDIPFCPTHGKKPKENQSGNNS
jgi:hypothetical protein